MNHLNVFIPSSIVISIFFANIQHHVASDAIQTNGSSIPLTILTVKTTSVLTTVMRSDKQLLCLLTGSLSLGSPSFALVFPAWSLIRVNVSPPIAFLIRTLNHLFD